MARFSARGLFLLGLLLPALAYANLCDPKNGWQNFEIGGGSSPTDPKARSVLDSTMAEVTSRLQKSHRLPKSCQLGRIYTSLDCMKPHIRKNHVEYGVYVSKTQVLYTCKSGARKWFAITTRTNVGRKGNLLRVAYEAKKIAAPQ